MLDPVVSALIALSGVLLFGSAVFTKMRAPSLFLATLKEYRIVPTISVRLVGGLIGAAEFAVSAGLLWPATRPVSGFAGAGLLLLYSGAIAVNLSRGRRDMDCGCGLQPRTIGSWMVVRNIFLAAALLLLLIPELHRGFRLMDLATIAGGLIVTSLLYASADLLLGRAAPRPLFLMEHP
ncbi:MAG: MauE/DoxX family redox-associated membrane protein [Gammaproteobacteria bacterium]